ncbi:MAG TPA: hypothetical protein VF254_08615 [Gammaproteobacteria bacterium]
MELSEPMMKVSREDRAPAEPLADYLREHPALMLTFLDVAERYAMDNGPDEGAR